MLNNHSSTMWPVRFPVQVAGVPQEALVLEDLGDLDHYRYRVRFQDGTEGVFTLAEGPELIILSDFPAYAAAIADDLYELSKIDDDGRFYFVYPAIPDGEPVNLWLVEEEPDPGEAAAIMVSYRRKLQYQLYKASGDEPWQVREIAGVLPLAEKRIARELAAAMDVAQGVVAPLAP